MIWGVSGNSERVQSVADLWLTGDKTERSLRKQSTEPFSVMAVCCLLLYIVEMVAFAVLFPVAIVKSDCQLVYSMEGSGFSLFLVCYQILEVIWQSLIELMA